MRPETELWRRACVEGRGAVGVGSVVAGGATGTSGELDDHLDADGSDHLPRTATDASRVVGVDRGAV